MVPKPLQKLGGESPLCTHTMAEVYAYLLEKKLVTLIFTRPRKGPPLSSFDQSNKCEHHFGAEGHTLEKCSNLRHRIQDLIDNKLI